MGTVLGAIVLGVGGRILMRVISLATAVPAGFSIGGSLEVVAAGALFGGLGGALSPLIPARLEVWRSVVHATVLFLLLALTSDAARSAAMNFEVPSRIFALMPFGALLLAYSIGLILLVADRKTHTPSTMGKEG